MSESVRRERFARRALRDGAVFVLAAVIAALAVRFTVRDRVPGFAALYFATPPVVLVAAAAGAAVAAWRLDRPRATAFGAALAGACGLLYVHAAFVEDEPLAPGALHGVFWNVRHGEAGWPTIAADLGRLDPDVAWLAESGDGRDGADDALHAALPGRRLVRTQGGLTVLCRGDVRVLDWEKLPDHGRAAVLEVSIGGHAFDTVFADLGCTLRTRSAPLGRVMELAAPHLGAPLLVLGDFNTPRDSAVFDGWRGRLTHAFEATGHGLDATWPVPCPVLAIDHVWAGGGILVRTCKLPWTWDSDHLPVVFTFDLP